MRAIKALKIRLLWCIMKVSAIIITKGALEIMNLHSYDSIVRGKMQAEKLAQAYQAVAFKNADSSNFQAEAFTRKAQAVHNCSTVWVGYQCPQCGRLHAMHTWGCKDRLCPICATRRSRMLAVQSAKVMPKIVKEGSQDANLVTLTVKNCNGFELPNTISRILQGWANITQSYDTRKTVDGWARSLEITYNRDTHTYHPHIHVILLSAADRWKDKGYWTERWRKACDLEYSPIIDTRPITKGKDGGAILEVCKYVTKTSELIDKLTPGELAFVVEPLSSAIRCRRMNAYGGDWAAERRRLKLKEPDEMDDQELSQADDEVNHSLVQCCGNDCKLVMLDWSGLSYDVIDCDNPDTSKDGIESILFKGFKLKSLLQEYEQQESC